MQSIKAQLAAARRGTNRVNRIKVRAEMDGGKEVCWTKSPDKNGNTK